MIECFAEMVHGFYSLTIFMKRLHRKNLAGLQKHLAERLIWCLRALIGNRLYFCKGAKQSCVILLTFLDQNLSCYRCSIWFDFFCLVMLYTNLLDMSLYSLIQVLLSFLRFVKLVSVFWNCTCTKFILVLQLKHASRYNYWPIKDQSTISMLPENAKNPEVVWRFRGVWKGIIVLKCVKCFC